MLEWTGERFLPWIKDPAIAYEHIHRYTYASQLARDKNVLDLASGEGYGSNLLATVAAKVVGVEIDAAAVAHAREKYRRENLEFLAASITAVPIPQSHCFDLVTCFEAIEHIDNQEGLLSEIKRLLKPDGLLIVSTPNKTAYDREGHQENPFHVKELEFADFQRLLEKYFRRVHFLGQRIFAQSNMWPIRGDRPPVREQVMKRENCEFVLTPEDSRVPLYLIAIASDALIPIDLPGGILVDSGNELLHEKDHEIAELTQSNGSLETGLKWKSDQVAQRDVTIAELEKAVAWQAKNIGEQKEGMDRLRSDIRWLQEKIEERQAVIAQQQAAIAVFEEVERARREQVAALESEKLQLQQTSTQALKQLGEAHWKLEEINASSGWKLVLKARTIRERLLPEGTLRRKMLRQIIRVFGKTDTPSSDKG